MEACWHTPHDSQIDFMALTMINPASSWFEIAELPVVEQLRWQTVNGKELLIANEILIWL